MKRKQHVEESIAKWEMIESELSSKEKRTEGDWWIVSYWNHCGYCNYYEECSNCSLGTYIDKYPICYGDFEDKTSHASMALSLADIGKYEEALEHCRIVLKAMRKDLEREET